MFKVIMLGGNAVGKSSILMRFTRGIFKGDLGATVGVEYSATIVKTVSDLNLKLQIWDTAGQ